MRAFLGNEAATVDFSVRSLRPEIKFQLKRVFAVSLIGSLYRLVQPHPTDGFIFTPTLLPVGQGTDYNVFKFKFKPSIDVLRTIDGQYMCHSRDGPVPLLSLVNDDETLVVNIPQYIVFAPDATPIVELDVNFAGQLLYLRVFAPASR